MTTSEIQFGMENRMGDDHFCSDKSKNERQAVAQINKSIDHVREQKVERTQPENGADVRGVDNELSW